MLSESCSLLHPEGPQVLLIQGNIPKEGGWRKKKPEAELILSPWAALIVFIALTQWVHSPDPMAILILQHHMRKTEQQINF